MRREMNWNHRIVIAVVVVALERKLKNEVTLCEHCAWWLSKHTVCEMEVVGIEIEFLTHKLKAKCI
ncbi:unnamed protein product [Albugo candida]|uniref:Uncharacterized protein n=1 Tax=Albugo candida TaxID=65357 RepID=A0A024FWU1_9STRA|nr:unnamed protein product [Albugo candida]|eukprot:CCI11653.1 unnamed protein product [Albugo candida]